MQHPMSEPKHPNPNDIQRGSRLWHIATKQYITTCNCASVSEYRKVGWAKSNPSAYYTAKPETQNAAVSV